MDGDEVDKLVQQLSAGFELLETEYLKLHHQHEALERKLATAREQVRYGDSSSCDAFAFCYPAMMNTFSSRSVAIRGVDRLSN